MPFGPAFAPSLGLSLLKSVLTRHGVASEVLYPSIRFAEMIGQHFYSGIAVEGRPRHTEMAGEWLFSAALFDRALRDDDPYFSECLIGRANWNHAFAVKPVSAAMVRRLAAARRHIPEFLQWSVDAIIARRPRIVGFTSVFQQHVGSLAAARLLKKMAPDIVIVFGGANCEGPMGVETVRQFPFIDAAVSGEGEIVLPMLVERVLSGQSIENLPGVRTQASVASPFGRVQPLSNAPTVRHMDDLPHPDYRDFMTQFRATRLDRQWTPTLFFESSRGCWWGERQHCTFCGLNGASMTFRSKSAMRAVDELATLASTYPGCDVQVSDNILDLQYFKDFLPELARRRLGVKLFYETKSNLKREQIRLLRDAGVLEIQPGIESLSDDVLKLMRKGVSALHNIQVLKWCKEFGVVPVWNILWGFPGEAPDAYARMAALVPHLTHLPAPYSFAGLRLDRFSPNFVRPADMGFEDVRPLPAYRHIYGFADDALANLAYSFTYRHSDGRDPATYVGPLLKALRRWQQIQRSEVDVVSKVVHGRLRIWDFRPDARQPLTTLSGIDRLLYESCDQIADVTQLAAVAKNAGAPLTIQQIDDRLGALIERGLLLKDGQRHLALALPVGEYVPSRTIQVRMDQTLRAAVRSQSRVKTTRFRVPRRSA